MQENIIKRRSDKIKTIKRKRKWVVGTSDSGNRKKPVDN